MVYSGEDASTEPTPPKTAIGWTKESTPLPPPSHASGGMNLNVHATSAGGLESPASISPIRPSVDAVGKIIANGGGHHHNHQLPLHGSFSHFQSGLSCGDLNDNLLDHHNGTQQQQQQQQQHSTSSASAVGANGLTKSGSDQQRISSSSSTSSSSSSSHPLYLFGMCRWPGCETPCDDLSTFAELVAHLISNIVIFPI